MTASILAVFERISFSLVERILQILCEEPNQALLEVKNQIKIKGAKSIPDGAIQASFAYWIETKVVPDAVWHKQLQEHLKALQEYPNIAQKKLIVLTPDDTIPKEVEQLKSPLVVWASFNSLANAIAEVLKTDDSWLTSDFPLASEQERFLLRELVQMFLAEGLLNSGKSDAVLIVPARGAIKDYENYSVYLCQPNRSFQKVEYIGFYHNGVIDHRIAKVLAPPIKSVVLDEEGIKEVINAEELSALDDSIRTSIQTSLELLVEKTRSDQHWAYKDTVQVFLLSSVDAKETISLNQDIRNDLRNAAGRPYAFTQGQRYVPLTSLLKHPLTTTELLNSA
ncbi:hypothetical protein ACN4EG_01570 [Alkalinema pantanalense CENA528]|uniref:hypothetical protein n=1 Tax=Alkalinema pantanalense TaxID=1620705 RepID=UPI003D6E7E09